MQSVADAFSVEEVDTVRKIAESAQFAWKKDYLATIRFFTIGVSSIGGNDIIAGTVAAQTAWNKYKYTDESAYLLRLSYERELNMPLGGLTKAIADLQVDNTSGRFSPRYTGGTSAIYTAVDKPGRPLNINAGFNYGGIDNMIPQFVGLTAGSPRFNARNRTVDFKAFDFMDYIQNAYVDKTAMFTAQRSDVVLQTALTNLGFATSQFDLDTGINIIGFGLFETGQKWGDYVNKIVQAENGHIYQDELGVIKFENRQHWQSYPYFNVQRVITTAQVLEAVTPTTDHIINVVEVKASPRDVLDSQLIWSATGYAGSGVISLPIGNTEVWANYDDPIYQVESPFSIPLGPGFSTFQANTLADGTGTDVTDYVSLKSIDNFAQTSKLVFTNSYSLDVFLTVLDIYGRPARKTGDIYYKEKVDSSITAYGEQPLIIENDYIQTSSWARSFAGLVLQDYARPENLQDITIRAVPELQMGDLISWQGKYWRIYGIRTQIDPGIGFVQELKLLQRTIVSYFQIGVSTIGGSDKIAP